MGSHNALSISLSVVLGSFLLLVLAELYYLLCRKKASSNSKVISVTQDSLFVEGENPMEVIGDVEIVANNGHYSLASSAVHADLIAKLFPVNSDGEPHDLGIDHLLVPPRMLFTINEETREDLESEGVRFHSRSQHGSQGSSEIFPSVSSETPFATPPTSPPPSCPQAGPRSSFLPSIKRASHFHVSAARSSPPSPTLSPIKTFMSSSSPFIKLNVSLATPPFTPPSRSSSPATLPT